MGGLVWCRPDRQACENRAPDTRKQASGVGTYVLSVGLLRGELSPGRFLAADRRTCYLFTVHWWASALLKNVDVGMRQHPGVVVSERLRCVHGTFLFLVRSGGVIAQGALKVNKPLFSR